MEPSLVDFKDPYPITLSFGSNVNGAHGGAVYPTVDLGRAWCGFRMFFLGKSAVKSLRFGQ